MSSPNLCSGGSPAATGGRACYPLFSPDNEVVRDASPKVFAFSPDVSNTFLELTVLKGIGPPIASALLAAYATDFAPFISDEATMAVIGDSKDYYLKKYVVFVEKMQAKAKVRVNLPTGGMVGHTSDIEATIVACKAADEAVREENI